MNKRSLFIIIGIIVGANLIGFGVFFWNNLRGIRPAILDSKEDIVKLIDNENENTKTQEVTNNTEFPLTLPDGFGISIYAKDLGAPRVIVEDPQGNVLVSVPSAGKVYRLVDSNTDGVSDKTETVLQGLRKPHGLAFDGNILFVAEENKVSSYAYSQAETKLIKKIVDLPTGGNHTSRSLLFANNQLLVATGSSCNVCNEQDNRRAAILAMNSDGSNQRIFASGLRNTVFMTQHPITGKVWGTDMGRDLLGDNTPPEEVNSIEEGKNYGWPVCYGQNIHDTNFDKNQYIQNPCNDKMPPVVEMQAHSAPLGLAFIPNSWSKEYQNDLIVAFHGSWNRSTPTGYKLVRIKLDANGRYEGIEDFISGWLKGSTALGRPVAVMFDTKGNLFVSDDKAGVIYKITKQ